jgi:hypothetical protein
MQFTRHEIYFGDAEGFPSLNPEVPLSLLPLTLHALHCCIPQGGANSVTAASS